MCSIGGSRGAAFAEKQQKLITGVDSRVNALGECRRAPESDANREFADRDSDIRGDRHVQDFAGPRSWVSAIGGQHRCTMSHHARR